MKFTKEMESISKPIETLEPRHIIEFEKAVENSPYSLSDILKQPDVKTIVFDKGFVSFSLNEDLCTVYAYYVSGESKDSSSRQRKEWYKMLKLNGCKRIIAYTELPGKVWRNWGFKLNRYEIIKEL